MSISLNVNMKRASFPARIRYATQCLLAWEVSHRGFSDCFEMGDGDAVAVALWRHALMNADGHALAAIFDVFTNCREHYEHPWGKVEHKHRHWPTQDLPKIATALRNDRALPVYTHSKIDGMERTLIVNNLQRWIDAPPFVRPGPNQLQRLIETYSFATEPTDQGLQYVAPGCEHDRTRGPAQMRFF